MCGRHLMLILHTHNPHTMSTPNFFTSSDETEKVYFSEDQKYWVEVKTDLTMDDIMKVQSGSGLSTEELSSPFKNTQLLLLACIVSWNLPSKEDPSKVAEVTLENIQRLNVKAFAKLAPTIQKVQDANFLFEGSVTPLGAQSSSEKQTPTI